MKTRVFRRMGIINTLLSGDCHVLSEEIGLENAVLCPYIAQKRPDVAPRRFEHRILIGNNDVFVSEYQNDVKLLAEHLPSTTKQAITLGTMLNYGHASDSDRSILRRYAEAFGKYIEWTDVLPYDEYCRGMADYDIYICSHQTQSGLGAAGTMLYYGKKCFLSGCNLAWFRELGFVVYDFEDCVKNHPEEFSTPLSDDALRQNMIRWSEKYSAEKNAAKWNGLFARLAGETA